MSAADRELLQAVLEALTLPHDAAGYDRRLLDRAAWARITLAGVLAEGDPEWHADYLRRKIRDEEAVHGGEWRG